MANQEIGVSQISDVILGTRKFTTGTGLDTVAGAGHCSDEDGPRDGFPLARGGGTSNALA